MPAIYRIVQPPDFLYFFRYWSCMRLMAPLRLVRMRLTADTASKPDSMRAMVTRIGARPRPATQCMPMAGLSTAVELLNTFLQMLSQLSTTALGGASPSGKGMSWNERRNELRKEKSPILGLLVSHHTVASIQCHIYYDSKATFAKRAPPRVTYMHSNSSGFDCFNRVGRVTHPDDMCDIVLFKHLQIE